MPVKNAAYYLDACLASIVEQTEQHWELLAIDDGSTDDSFQKLLLWAKRDPRIKPYQNEGSGIIDALRFALAKSVGAFITRMDADDLMPPQKLFTLKNTLAQFGERHLATGLVQYFTDEGKTLGEGYAHYESWLNELTLRAANFQDIYKECSIPSPCWMVFRNDLLRCGAFMPNVYPEDYDLAFRFYEGGLRVVGIGEVLHLWRDHTERSSRTSEHYADNRFLHLKLSYFLKLEKKATHELLLWGAGQKGKQLARALLRLKVSFRWLTDNPNKQGRDIYGQRLEKPCFENGSSYQVLVAVADRKGRVEVAQFLSMQQAYLVEVFWFC